MYTCTYKCNRIMSNQPIKLRDALQKMRDLSELNIPFSIGFFTCDTTNKISKGYKVVDKAILRPGYRANQSNKADILIAYIDYKSTGTEDNKQFYLPLLMMFNGQYISI